MKNKWNIEKGKILIYRVFDIGEEINLEKTEKILIETSATRSKFRLKKSDRQAVIVSNAPLMISLGAFHFQVEGHSFTLDLNAKLWDYGTLSISFEYFIPPETTISGLREISKLMNEFDDLDVYAKLKARELAFQIESAMAKMNMPSDWEMHEDYIIFFVEKFSGEIVDAADILKDKDEDIAALILNEESGVLAPQIYERLYESKLQYYKNDLAVIDWNSAFVVEPTGSLDIPDVLEFALNQLLEMRFYDDLLDVKLREIYSAIELKEMNLFSARYSNLALEAGQRYIEIAEIVESVENSLKVIGDLYHSVVFRTASKKFRFTDWQSSIDNKLNNLNDISKILLDNINHKRSHLLEITVIILISIELIPLYEHLKNIFH